MRSIVALVLHVRAVKDSRILLLDGLARLGTLLMIVLVGFSSMN